MSVAYVILAHHRPGQLARLVGRLEHPEDRAFIHVDRRVQLAPFVSELSPQLRTGRAQLARRRFATVWADYSLVAATLATLEQALQEATFGHVMLLSGDDYPLVPTEILRAFLHEASDRSFMLHAPPGGEAPLDRRGNERWYWNGDLRRLTFRHYRLLGRQWHVPNRVVPDLPRLAPPADLALYQGSQWWTLSRAAAQYVVEAFVRRPELRRFFRRVQAPDEFAFPMVLGSSPLRDTIVNDDLHYIDWHGWHARELTRSDLPALADTTKPLVRKVGPDLVDGLDQLIARRARDPAASLEALRARHRP